MSALIALHRALYFPGSLVLILAPSERQAKETFSKVSGYYHEIHGAPPPSSDRKLGMHLSNGSRIEALPGSERTVRGFSGVSLLVLDEASRVDDSLFHAVKPMLAVSGGAMIMLSTPHGKRGVFHAAWTEGEEWERYRVTAEDVPRISPEFLAQERKSLPARIYRQEYECSFEDVEDQVFSYELVEQALSSDVAPLFDDPTLPWGARVGRGGSNAVVLRRCPWLLGTLSGSISGKPTTTRPSSWPRRSSPRAQTTTSCTSGISNDSVTSCIPRSSSA